MLINLAKVSGNALQFKKTRLPCRHSRESGNPLQKERPAIRVDSRFRGNDIEGLVMTKNRERE